ncbi:MAG: HEPN domain-containing protein [Endomicrobium sp.]|jgi:uncharacterized protein (UPF0332 family)|nr:HEPN domain-containing protein [Endomicrobium sp.]
MQPLNEELVKIYIEKSKTALKSAEINIKNNLLETALNRIYYAVFYIVMALGYKYDFKTSKHSKLMGWFNKKFIHEDKIFSNEIYRTYESAFLYRHKSDYDAVYVPNIEKTISLLADAKIFVDTVSKEI